MVRKGEKEKEGDSYIRNRLTSERRLVVGKVKELLGDFRKRLDKLIELPVGYTGVEEEFIFNTPIMIWNIDTCPDIILEYIANKDDIDWIALVQNSYDITIWMDSGTSFGCCDTEEIQCDKLRGTIVVGRHS